MQAELTIVFLTVDEAAASGAASALSQDYRLIRCRTESETMLRLDEVQAHLLIVDGDRGDTQADEAQLKSVLVSARISHPHVARMVICSPREQERCAQLAHRAAAFLYLLKPVPATQLRLAATRALELAELSRRHRLLSRELKISIDDQMFNDSADVALSVKGGASQFERLVYISSKMADLCAEARLAARTELPVLIHGETGTGKELLARAIHFNSHRLNAPMHVQNCGGLSDDTLHSELFGHVRGAFTGAIADRLGLFRAADGGAVFLDEISEISPRFQVSLLRFLQEREVKPLGSDKVVHADVRIIAASNRPLERLVAQGLFRRDLYYRLKGFELLIPPLRDRPEDIPVLTQFFVEKYAGVVGRRVVGVAQDTLGKLAAYDYPGNVRELETEVRRMVAVADQGGYIGSRHLSSVFDNVLARPPAPALDEGGTLKEMVEQLERQLVVSALKRYRWNQSRAADELGLSRVGLANKIKRYALLDG